MAHTCELNGHTWTLQKDAPCACCGQRTYRMCRRTPTELIWERYPGTEGAHTFTSRRPHTPGRTFVICEGCFTGRFTGERKKVLAWEAERVWRQQRVAVPTSE